MSLQTMPRHRTAHSLWQTALAQSFDAIVQLDARGNIVEWNPQAERCFGWFRHEVIGQALHELIFPVQQYPHHLQWLSRCLQDESGALAPQRLETQGLHRTGNLLPLELSIAPVHAPHGMAFVATLRDLSERKRTEEALRIAAAAFQSLEGMVITNAQYVIVKVNEAFSRITGYGAYEAIGKQSYLFRPGHAHAASHPGLLGQLAREHFWQGRVWDRRKNGELYPAWVRIMAVTDPQAQVNHYVMAFVDSAAQYPQALPGADGGLVPQADQGSPDERPNRSALHTWMQQGLPDQFALHYQLQVDTAGRPTGAEALVRWDHPQHGRIAPTMFLPLAEESGWVLTLGAWVLHTACRQLACWARSAQTRDLTLAVNVSARQFHSEGFVQVVSAALADAGAPARLLQLELAEGLMLHDMDDVLDKMQALKRIGVQLVIDGFGTGYSSLSCLKRLPLDRLKIDPTLVRALPDDPHAVAIARSVLALGHSLGLQVVAVGVENVAQQVLLQGLACDALQGYWFGRPVDASRLEAALVSASTTPHPCAEGA